MFKTKGKSEVYPFEFLDQYCKVKVALTIESYLHISTSGFYSDQSTRCLYQTSQAKRTVLVIKDSDDKESDNEEIIRELKMENLSDNEEE